MREMCFILSDGLQLLRDQLYAVIYGDRRCEEGVAACLGPVAEAPKPVPAEFSSHRSQYNYAPCSIAYSK